MLRGRKPALTNAANDASTGPGDISRPRPAFDSMVSFYSRFIRASNDTHLSIAPNTMERPLSRAMMYINNGI